LSSQGGVGDSPGMIAPSLRRLSAFALCLAPFVLGCDDDGGSGGGGSLSALNGVYPIDTWTQNQTACDVEGPSVLELQASTLLGVGTSDLAGYDFLVAIPCADDQSCADSVDGGIFAALGGGAVFTEGQGNDQEGWETGSLAYAVVDTECQGRFTSARLETVGSQQLRLDQVGYDLVFPAVGDENSDDRCPVETAQQLSESAPCTSRETIVGTYARPLPEPTDS